MIEHHAAIARSLGEQLELPDGVLEALGAAYEQWDGKGWPGELAGDAVPIASRLAQLAEFVEVAHRVGGVDAARELARERGGKQFDPALADLLRADAEMMLAGLDAVGTWDAVIDAEPALAIVLSGERFDAALRGDRELRRPEVAVHARARARRRRPRRRGRARSSGWPRTRCGRCAAPGSCTTSGGSGSRTRSGTSRAARRRRMGAGAHAPVPHRAHAAPVRGAGAARRDRRAAPRAPRRLGLPARAVGRRDLAPGADPRRRRRLPGDARAAPAPAARVGRRGGGRAARRGQGRAASTPRRSRRCSAPPAIACRAAARARPA